MVCVRAPPARQLPRLPRHHADRRPARRLHEHLLRGTLGLVVDWPLLRRRGRHLFPRHLLRPHLRPGRLPCAAEEAATR
eukprot:6358782-Prymnesium_polylepis.2